MKIYLLILAVVPVAIFIWWIRLKDRYEKEPIIKLISYFILGIVVSILAIVFELYLNKLDIFTGIAKIYILHFL